MDEFSEYLKKFDKDNESRLAAHISRTELDKKAFEIASLLKELEKVENENGINSLEYANICKVLKGVLDDERSIANNFVANIGAVVLDFSLLEDNAVWVCNYDIEESAAYHEQWIVEIVTHEEDSTEALTDIANSQINAEILRRTTDKSLKYKLAYADPLLCYELTLSNFKPGLIEPEAELARIVAGDDEKGADLLDIHIKKFTEILYTLCCKEYDGDNLLYEYLMVILPFIPELIVSEIIEAADSHPYEQVTTEKAKEVYNTLLVKMAAKQKEKE